MAIKTFTTGEVLTASDTNTYLANAGLVQITSGITVTSAGGTAATVSNGTITVGSGNTSVTVTGAFSATYDNYVIVYVGGTVSVSNADIGLQLRVSGTTSTTGYYSTFIFGPSLTAFNTTNGSNWLNAGGGANVAARMRVELEAPFLAQRTTYFSKSPRTDVTGTSSGYHDSATSYDSFVVLPNASTITGGTITVYGYRKA